MDKNKNKTDGLLLFRIESFHDDGRGSVVPRKETFVRASSFSQAREYACSVLGVPLQELMLSLHKEQPPVDSIVLDASRA